MGMQTGQPELGPRFRTITWRNAPVDSSLPRVISKASFIPAPENKTMVVGKL